MLSKFGYSAAVLGSERSAALGSNCMKLPGGCNIEVVCASLFAPI
jgi:hypothetical protein